MSRRPSLDPLVLLVAPAGLVAPVLPVVLGARVDQVVPGAHQRHLRLSHFRCATRAGWATPTFPCSLVLPRATASRAGGRSPRANAPTSARSTGRPSTCSGWLGSTPGASRT